MRRALALTLLALAACAPAALAGEYDPGTVPPESTSRPSSSGRVLHVRPRDRGGIQAAVGRARAGDTIRVAPGTYRGGIEIRGASRRGLRILATRATVRGGVRIRGTAAITLRGLTVAGGGIVLRNVDRYVLDRLRVTGSERAGIEAIRSPGGRISRVLAAGNDGAGIAITRTPARRRAVRTFVRAVTVQDNTVGISLDRVRAVTVSRARVLGNSVGVSATGATDVVLRDNDIRSSGAGVAISGGRTPLMEENRMESNIDDVVVVQPPEA